VKKLSLASLLLLPLLTGCLGYPKFHYKRFKGTAALGEDGKPVNLAATIIKECESWKGDTEDRGYMRRTTTDEKGRYNFSVMGFAWRSKSWLTETACTSFVQLFSCKPHCKKADQIDIDVLGK
jgi:hypothetical protein